MYTIVPRLILHIYINTTTYINIFKVWFVAQGSNFLWLTPLHMLLSGFPFVTWVAGSRYTWMAGRFTILSCWDPLLPMDVLGVWSDHFSTHVLSEYIHYIHSNGSEAGLMELTHSHNSSPFDQFDGMTPIIVQVNITHIPKEIDRNIGKRPWYIQNFCFQLNFNIKISYFKVVLPSKREEEGRITCINIIRSHT